MRWSLAILPIYVLIFTFNTNAQQSPQSDYMIDFSKPPYHIGDGQESTYSIYRTFYGISSCTPYPLQTTEKTKRDEDGELEYTDLIQYSVPSSCLGIENQQGAYVFWFWDDAYPDETKIYGADLDFSMQTLLTTTLTTSYYYYPGEPPQVEIYKFGGQPNDNSIIRIELYSPEPVNCSTNIGSMEGSEFSPNIILKYVDIANAIANHNLHLSIHCEKPISSLVVDTISDSYFEGPQAGVAMEKARPLLRKATIHLAPISTPDLSIDKVTIGQVVMDPDYNQDGVVDMVKGKGAMAQVKLGITGLSDQDRNKQIDVNMQIQDGTDTQQYTFQTTAGEIMDSSSEEITQLFTPNSTGPLQIQVEAHFADLTDSNTENNFFEKDAIVKQTSGIKVLYIPVGSCITFGCYKDVSEAQVAEIRRIADPFLTDIWPISPSQLTTSQTDVWRGSSSIPVLGLYKDMIMLNIMGWTLGYDKTIGVVDPPTTELNTGYFIFHHSPELLGLWIEGLDSVLVDSDRPEVIAHELGHAIADLPDTYQSQPDISYTGGPISGFQASLGLEGYIQTGQRKGIMGSYSHVTNIDHLWVQKSEYERLYSAFLRPKVDPNVLIVGFTLSKDGTVTPVESITSNNGNLSQNEQGDYTLQVLDSNGNQLVSLGMAPDFFQYVDKTDLTGGQKSVDTVPIVKALPFVQGARTLQISKKGQILYTADIQQQLFSDAINNIPLAAYKWPQTQRQKILQKHLQKFDGLLKKNKNLSALMFLKNVIKQEIIRFVRSDYAGQSPINTTRDSALNAISKLESNIQSDIAHSTHSKCEYKRKNNNKRRHKFRGNQNHWKIPADRHLSRRIENRNSSRLQNHK